MREWHDSASRKQCVCWFKARRKVPPQGKKKKKGRGESKCVHWPLTLPTQQVSGRRTRAGTFPFYRPLPVLTQASRGDRKWQSWKVAESNKDEGGRTRSRRKKRSSHQLPGEEEVVLAGHHHADALSLPGAAQHGHQLLLAAARHVNPVHLQAEWHETHSVTPLCLWTLSALTFLFFQ